MGVLALLMKLFGLGGKTPPVPTLPPDVPLPAPAPTKVPSIASKPVAVWLALAVTFVGGWEGLYTHAYKDSVGVTTICFGVTNADRKVRMGDTATKEQCQDMLKEDLPRYYGYAKKCIPGLDSFPPHRQVAMVSFVYNVGQGNLCKSSVAKQLNAGHVQQGCNALMQWNRAGGRVLQGLTNRRVAERKFCLRND